MNKSSCHHGLDPASIIPPLLADTPSTEFVLAYSGGVDSHALLHLLATHQQQTPGQFHLRAIYIDHGLQAESQEWALHCSAVAKSYGIAFQSITVNIPTNTNESLEALARTARYKTLAENIKKNEILLTAQHQDDQAETLMLQMLRGSGLAGLSAMPYKRKWQHTYHIRPLLNVSRTSIEEYAKLHKLNFIEDPSNDDVAFDRNFLRHKIIPTLKEHWPALANTFARNAQNIAEQNALLDQYLQRDFDKLYCSHTQTLSTSGLSHFQATHQAALLRMWLMRVNERAPSRNIIYQIIHELLPAKPDQQPVIRWASNQVRRYHNKLYHLETAILDTDLDELSWNWDLKSPLALTPLSRQLQSSTLGELESLIRENHLMLTVRLRQHGERIRPANSKHSRSVKKLLQEFDIPPWERALIPFIYWGDKLIQVNDIARIHRQELQDEINRTTL